MCTVSYIGDDFNKRIGERFPNYTHWIQPVINHGPSREEFEALKREMQELKELLKAAKKYDDATGQRDCEMASKIELLTKLAELVGVDLSEVFPAQAGEAGAAETPKSGSARRASTRSPKAMRPKDRP